MHAVGTSKCYASLVLPDARPTALALLLVGCYASHETGRRPREDAGAIDDASAARDAGAERCLEVDVTLAEDIYRLVRAREGDVTKLAVGRFTPRVGERPVEIWDVAFGADGGPAIHAHPAIPGTAGAQPAAGSLRGPRMALAIDQGESPDELLVIDLATDEILARGVLDETLTSGFVTYAWLALDDARLVASVGLPEGGSRLRVYDVGPSGFSLAFETTTDRIQGPATAVAIAHTEPIVREVLEHVLGASTLASFPDVGSHLVDVDRGRVLSLDGLEVSVDGATVGMLDRGTSSIYGDPTLAIGARRVIAVTTDRGLRLNIDDLGAPLAWRDASMAFLAGLASAHADAENAGIFFVEPAFGSEPARLRYVGERCSAR